MKTLTPNMSNSPHRVSFKKDNSQFSSREPACILNQSLPVGALRPGHVSLKKKRVKRYKGIKIVYDPDYDPLKERKPQDNSVVRVDNWQPIFPNIQVDGPKAKKPSRALNQEVSTRRTSFRDFSNELRSSYILRNI
jgi:hypothetical protein